MGFLKINTLHFYGWDFLKDLYEQEIFSTIMPGIFLGSFMISFLHLWSCGIKFTHKHQRKKYDIAKDLSQICVYYV